MYTSYCSSVNMQLRGGRPPKANAEHTSVELRTRMTLITYTRKTAASVPQYKPTQVQYLTPKASTSEIAGHFTCAVCLEILISPLQLRCNHITCAECLVKAINYCYSSSEPKCPICSYIIVESGITKPASIFYRFIKSCQ